ncbi:MAG TPA: SDR family NAD(P)-dependent oxidoreductase [Clostridiales bacterium]|nr:SDR family NAD(P)-dependent oxidoreductase [Clostridiales bacterium]
MKLARLIALSQEYGRNADLVLAGGGNTSVKDGDIMYVKASGTSLASIEKQGFVAMDLPKLKAILNKKYEGDEDAVEAHVLADMMASRLPLETGRPSVEALLHGLFLQDWVVHLHPAPANGLTCGKNGQEMLAKLFGDDAIWLPEGKPGYTLAVTAYAALQAYKEKHKKDATLLFLQNHGVFFAGGSEEEVRALVEKTMETIDRAIGRRPDFSDISYCESHVASVLPVIRAKTGAGVVSFFTNAEIAKLVASKEAAAPVLGAYSPDHIVYCGHMPAFTKAEQTAEGLDAYYEAFGIYPKIVLIEGLGAAAIGKTWQEADTAKALFLDAVKISTFTESFGGRRFMDDGLVAFIRSWEVEKYRKSVSVSSSAGRLAGKVTVITGGAQGFGEGLARAALKEGAYCVLADLNFEKASELAAELCGTHGKGRAVAIACNVADEASVKALCEKTVCLYGGIDVFVSNAGILRSGGLEEMDYQTFELMTKVNYSAFFLCAKYASRSMKLEQKIAPEKYFDILQINSKSGLTGSNKNFAYAGGKFGGIGLVQSFALELVEYNIKVNAICPGNLLDGPLWSGPEKGLFVQYLRAGKVPGAKTVEDVRKAYEAKVPMRRGCTVDDVALAMFYAVEQKYETGQAIPVTGGQNMLK